MLLFITNSTDATADLLFKNFDKSAFRLNFDLWQDYSVILQPDQWEILNPIGLKITEMTATHCFWWKAFQATIDADPYIVAEIKYVLRALYGSFLRRRLVVGNPPGFHSQFGKLLILKIASCYFRTPQSVAG
jgi:hypothetical protein